MSAPNATLWLGLVCLGAVACGARSDVRCFGGECIGGAGAGASTGTADEDDEDITPPPDNPFSPPVDVTPDPPPSMEMPVDDDLPVSGRGDLCRNRGRAQGPIVVDSRRELGELRGCVEVQGDLTISGFDARDLRELSSLERVTGDLHLGVNASLQGLESLRQVGSLTLDGLRTGTLAPLANLNVVGSVEGDAEAALDIRNSEGFANLAGLEGSSPIRGRVQINRNPQLLSLQGLRLADSMDELEVRANASLIDLGGDATLVTVNRLKLESNNQLSDISALGALAKAGILDLEGLAIQSLAALQALTEATNISLMENPVLADVQRLGAVQFQSLRVLRNERLSSLPEFALQLALQEVQIRDNPALVTAPSFPNVTAASRIVISRSPNITSITGFPALQTVGTFEVRDNPNLVELELGSLASYSLARIVCNAVFPEASIASYLAARGGQLELRGNFGSSAPCE